MDKKLKHLELIQNAINRLANSSFFLKGWTVIFVAAVLGFATKDSKPMYVWLAAIPTVSFWVLDGFYLNQEKRFRRLYDAVVTSFSTPGALCASCPVTTITMSELEIKRFAFFNQTLSLCG